MIKYISLECCEHCQWYVPECESVFSGTGEAYHEVKCRNYDGCNRVDDYWRDKFRKEFEKKYV